MPHHRQKAVQMPLSDMLSAAGALGLVIGLIALLRFGTRFLGSRTGASRDSRLSLAAHLAVDGKRRLLLVQCDGGQVLLLTGGASDVMLAWTPGAGVAPQAGHQASHQASRHAGPG
jgi:flagellar protein FliO/FliZ